MDFELFWEGYQFIRQTLPFRQWNSGIGIVCPLFVQEWRPIHCKLAFKVTQDWIKGLLAFIHCGSIRFDHLIPCAGCNNSLSLESIGIQFASTGMLRNDAVHQGLGHCGCILLVMT